MVTLTANIIKLAAAVLDIDSTKYRKCSFMLFVLSHR